MFKIDIMPKFLLTFLTICLLGFINTKVFAATSRLYDFNNTSDLTNYFNPDSSSANTNGSVGGILESGYVDVQMGTDEIWTTKKGFNTSGVGDTFEISGYFYNFANLDGKASIGFTDSDQNEPGSNASTITGVGLSFFGNGAYLVSNQQFNPFFWAPDLTENTWYKITLVAENIGGNKFNLTFILRESDSYGVTSSIRNIETLEVTNPDLASASRLYAYFGTTQSRVNKIDNLEVKLHGNVTFEEDGKPTITTTITSNISSDRAVSGGNVVSEMGNSITNKGVCYKKSSNPTISDTCTTEGNQTGSFTSNLTNLDSNTLYYYRAYATNTNGTSYGTEYTFRTLDGTSTSNNSTKKFNKFTKCVLTKPPQVTWIKLEPFEKNGKKGMILTWSQLGANLVTIQIDNGTGKFPYSITKTKNDGKEFLVNVTALQKIRIIPINGCKTGDPSQVISRFTHPLGYFKK